MSHRRRPVVLKRDHARPRTPPAPTTDALTAHLTDLIQPAVFAQADADRRLGLREQVLALPAMVAIVLAIVWRQVPAVSDARRLLAQEGVCGTPALRVRQHALNQRLRALPESLGAGIWATVAPTVPARAATRTRPLPPVIARGQRHDPRLWALDGSTLEALFKTVGLGRPAVGTVLGGTLAAVLDLATTRPVPLWRDPDLVGNDLRVLERVTTVLGPGTLVVLDAADDASPCCDGLTEQGCGCVVRARTARAETVVQVLHEAAQVRDRTGRMGLSRAHPGTHRLRVVAVKVNGTWRPALTNVRDPQMRSVADVVELDGRRWKIEAAVRVTKRRRGLSARWSGASTGIALQVWATWLRDAVLVDLSAAVAAEVGQPRAAMSVAMTLRGLSHCTRAFSRGEATDPVADLAAQDDLGLVKRRRKYRERRRTALDTWRQELNL